MVTKTSSMVFTQYFTVILNSVQDAVLLLDIEPKNHYRILLANDAFFGMTGYSKDAIGKLIDEITADESRNKLHERYAKVREIKKPIIHTEWYDVPLGKQLFTVKLIPIFNAVGDCVQLASITQNVTEQHHMREQQKEAAETLEQVAYNLRSL
jgi:PAS domain S-box-containing protein